LGTLLWTEARRHWLSASTSREIQGFRMRNVRNEIYRNAMTDVSRTARGEGIPMTRYVIGPDVAVHLARDQTVISDEHRLLAPTLLRSQVLSRLYRAVRQDEMTKKEADRQLAYLRALRIRLLGDSALQNRAWKIADQLGWPDTLDAEYVALTQLQADAFITLDANLTHAVNGLVTIASIQALS
jgi:predicted nucleic acid-binding protein